MIEIHKTEQTIVLGLNFIQIPHGPHIALQHLPESLPPSGKGYNPDTISKTLDVPKNKISRYSYLKKISSDDTPLLRRLPIFEIHFIVFLIAAIKGKE